VLSPPVAIQTGHCSWLVLKNGTCLTHKETQELQPGSSLAPSFYLSRNEVEGTVFNHNGKIFPAACNNFTDKTKNQTSQLAITLFGI